jgi:hypothetical protein
MGIRNREDKELLASMIASGQVKKVRVLGNRDTLASTLVPARLQRFRPRNKFFGRSAPGLCERMANVFI